MSDSLERPPSVPMGAVWQADRGEWELAEWSEARLRHGLCRTFRRDGSLRSECYYENGKRHGELKIWHPNGDLAREGQFENGNAVGTFVAYASKQATNERLRSCCVPPGAWSMRSEYREGRLSGERFFDAEGRLLLADGSLHPERPAQVPVEAWYDAHERCWVTGKRDPEGKRLGEWLFFSVEGALIESAHFQNGERSGRRERRDLTGKIELREHHANGVLHGPYFSSLVGPEHFRNQAIRAVEGEFSRGRAVGTWTFFDQTGAPLSSRELGSTCSDEELLTALTAELRCGGEAGRFAAAMGYGGGVGPEPPPPESWSASASKNVGATLIAAARWAGIAKDSAQFERLWALHVEPLSLAESQRLIERVKQSGEKLAAEKWQLWVDALLRGCEPWVVLRQLALELPGSPEKAMELVEAALLLAGPVTELVSSRAALRLELGSPVGALADARSLGEAFPDTVRFFELYTAILFPHFGFWPSRVALLDLRIEELSDTPVQPLANIVVSIQKYATRLSLIRSRILQLVGAEKQAEPWLPPDVTHLLPNGLLELKAWSFSAEAPEGTDTVLVDETLNLETSNVVELMRQARVAWAGLTWLCFSVGLDEVKLPENLLPCPDFAKALGTSMQRCFRGRDQEMTMGLKSRTQGLEGFEWEGMPIENVPSVLLSLMMQEQLEMRAVLFYLADASCESPFQDDLRAI